MLRFIMIGFLIAHGLVHVAIWAPRYDPQKAPFDASRSWLIGDQRGLGRCSRSLWRRSYCWQASACG